MKISKKKALKYAGYEYELRNSEWEPLEDDPDWTLYDQVEQDGIDHWIESPASSIATMMYDGLFQGMGRKELLQAKRFFGAKLWDQAVIAYILHDHDT